MNRRLPCRALALSMVLLLTSFCAAKQSADIQTSQVHRGLAVWGHEVREFRPCGSDAALWVVDETRELWQRYREIASDSEPYTEVYVELRGEMGPPPFDGFGAEYPGMIRVTEVLDAGPASSGCTDE